MFLTDLNRDGGIGANSLFLEIGPFRVLVDAGLHPKKAGCEATPQLAEIAAQDLDLILLTHCHLDHLGSIPLVLAQHTRAPVLMSIPSLHLAARMLHNSVNVMSRQRAEAGIVEYPLFTHEEVDRAESRFFAQAYGQVRKLSKDGHELEVSLHAAGHVAGACGVLLVYRHRRIFLTGDVLFGPQLTLPGASFPEAEVDTLILETTRGATERQAAREREGETDRFLSTLALTVERGGSALIPVFALGRMQEVFAMLHRGRKEGLLPECPIFAGGLGMDLVDYFDVIARKTSLVNFSRHLVKGLKVKQPPRDITPGRSPGQKGIYLLSSGMVVENTPSYRLAAALLSGHENSICFVGYCDPDTPGGEILRADHGSKILFRALQHEATVRAQVERFEFTGHADREELMDFALARRPRAVVLTHGDPPARDWFAREFAVRAPEVRVLDPKPLHRSRV